MGVSWVEVSWSEWPGLSEPTGSDLSATTDLTDTTGLTERGVPTRPALGPCPPGALGEALVKAAYATLAMGSRGRLAASASRSRGQPLQPGASGQPADPAGKPLQTSKPSQLVLACQLGAQPQQRFASSSTRQQARAKQVEDQALLNPLGPAVESAA